MLFLFTGVSALAPSLLLVWYFHRRDLYPEPPRVLWTTFGLGVISVLFVLPVEWIVSVPLQGVEGFIGRGAGEAFFEAAIPEEFFKLAVLLAYSYRQREFDEPMDGIVYGAVASLGFATLENVLYVFNGGMGVAVVRALTAVPFHASAGAIMGYFAGRARFLPGRKLPLILKGFGAAVLLHGLYDFPLLSLEAAKASPANVIPPGPLAVSGLLLLTLASLIFSMAWTIKLIRRSRRDQMKTMTPLSPPAPEKVGRKDRISGVIQTVAGFIGAGVGGMMTLALALAFAFGMVAADEVFEVVLGGAIIGLAPLLLGLILFVRGIRRLNHPASGPGLKYDENAMGDP